MYTFISYLWAIPFAIFITSSISSVSLRALHKTNLNDEIDADDDQSKVLVAIMAISLVLFIILFFLIESTKMPTRNVTITPEPIDVVTKDTFTGKVVWKDHDKIHVADDKDCVFVEIDETKLDVVPTTQAPYHTTRPSGASSDMELPYHEVVRTQYRDSVQIFGKRFNSEPHHSSTFHRFYVSKGYFEDDDKK